MSTTSLREEALVTEGQVTTLSGLHNADACVARPTAGDYPGEGTSLLLKLPDEILSNIFVYCDGEFVTIPVPKDTAWLAWYQLGLVCSHWRHVLWSSPYLLNDIKFDSGLFFGKIPYHHSETL